MLISALRQKITSGHATQSRLAALHQVLTPGLLFYAAPTLRCRALDTTKFALRSVRLVPAFPPHDMTASGSVVAFPTPKSDGFFESISARVAAAQTERDGAKAAAATAQSAKESACAVKARVEEERPSILEQHPIREPEAATEPPAPAPPPMGGTVSPEPSPQKPVEAPEAAPAESSSIFEPAIHDPAVQECG